MKGTVREYVEKEVQQLTKECESLEKAQKMLEEIDSFFGDFKLDSFETLMYSSSSKKNSISPKVSFFLFFFCFKNESYFI